jgi:hypothetical protein
VQAPLVKTKPALQTQIPSPLSYELAPQVMVALETEEELEVEAELDDPDPDPELEPEEVFWTAGVGVITTVEEETEGRLHFPFW